MEENNLYWLKLYNDFMDRDEIQILRSQENGDSYVVFYLTLMLKSEKTGGYMRLNNNIAYDARMLAAVTRTNIDIVKAALVALQSLELIEIFDDGTIFIPEVQKLIGTSANNANAKRQQRFRDSKKLAAVTESVTKRNACVTDNVTGSVTESVTNNNACVTEGVTQNNVESEIEIELELEKELELELELDKIEEEKRVKEREKKDAAAGPESPSLDDVKKYARQRDSFVNPVRFFNYYAARGWIINGDPVRDWQALFVSWETREPKIQEEAAQDPPRAAPKTKVKEEGWTLSETMVERMLKDFGPYEAEKMARGAWTDEHWTRFARAHGLVGVYDG